MSRLPLYVPTEVPTVEAEIPQKSAAQKWAELMAIATILTCVGSAAHFLGIL